MAGAPTIGVRLKPIRTGLFFSYRFWSLLLRLVRFLNGANILAP